jgi:hypothetical protein
MRSVTPGYFTAMKLQLISGRTFTAADSAGAPLVLVINETMARQYWPDALVVGRRVAFAGSSAWREIVGVVRDVRHWGLDQPVNPEMYAPLSQLVFRGVTAVIATDHEPASLARPFASSCAPSIRIFRSRACER